MCLSRVEVLNLKHSGDERKNNMNPRIQNVGDQTLQPGQVVVGTVKFIRPEGIPVAVPAGNRVVNGTLSPRCFGHGAERVAAMAKINPGDKIEMVVRNFDSRTNSASLVLRGFENMPRLPKKMKVRNPESVSSGVARQTKPQFVPEEKGCVFVFDLANVAGELPMACIPNAKAAIEERFAEAGYSVLFYLEKRAACWLSHALPSEAAKDKFFSDFRANGNASYVGSYKKVGSTEKKRGESDQAILATVAAIPQAVACSCDGFRDYSDAYAEVIENRVRQFCVVTLPNGSAVLTVEGAGCGAAIIPPFVEAPQAEEVAA